MAARSTATARLTRRMKTFSVENAGERIIVECPHCGGRALVSRRWLLGTGGREYSGPQATRICTYCSRTSSVPGSF